jgi:hypothetical protein
VAGESQYGYHGTYYSYQPFETGRRRLPEPEEEEANGSHDDRTNGHSRKHRRLPSPSKAQ